MKEQPYHPHTVEPSVGLDRVVMALLLEALHEEEVPGKKGATETRSVLSNPRSQVPDQLRGVVIGLMVSCLFVALCRVQASDRAREGRCAASREEGSFPMTLQAKGVPMSDSHSLVCMCMCV